MWLAGFNICHSLYLISEKPVSGVLFGIVGIIWIIMSNNYAEEE